MDTPVQQSTQKSWVRNVIENILYILVAIGLAVVVQSFLIRPFIVNGTSMDPTFKSNDYLIIDEISYRFSPPDRGDVIVFKAPPEPNKYYIKRVIGLPGDTVILDGTTITIVNNQNPQGIVLDQSFITHPESDHKTYTVPAGEYFVMGDNRSGSYDSRSWGMLPAKNIRGRALLRLLPLSHISVLPGEVDYGKES